ncbi:MAG: sel1 repeat family protein [Proteobacteria bacterium]|nr:sel1 repeat family protein [Pseudomonadota bacterium]
MVALSGYDLSQKRDKWREYAATGDVYAMYELGESYSGHAMEGGIDGAEAFKWYCEAARHGYGKSQMLVGEVYQGTKTLPGVDIAPDFAKAHMWYSLAKRRAMHEAYEHLAVLEPQMEAKDIHTAEKLITNYRKVPCGVEEKHAKPAEGTGAESEKSTRKAARKKD